MKTHLLFLLTISLLLAQEPFAEGIVSTSEYNEYSLTFVTNDHILFTRNVDGPKIFESFRKNGSWSKPKVASFSEKFDNEYPRFDPIKKRVYFSSTRPVNGVEQERNDIWYSEFDGKSWTPAKHLGGKFSSPEIDSGGCGYGDIVYFHSNRFGGGFNGIDIFVGSLTDEKPVEKVSFSSDKVDGEVHLFNNGNSAIFMSAGHGSIGQSDIFVVHKKNGNWQKPIAITEVNTTDWDYSPTLSPDGKTLYYTVPANGDINILMKDIDLRIYK